MSVSNNSREGIYVLPQKTAIKRLAVFLSLAVFSGIAFSATTSDIESLLEDGKNQQALAASDSYLSSNAGDTNARFLRGIALARLGKSDAAVDVFGELAREHPESPEYANNLAVLYAKKGEYEKARRWLEAAMSTHPAYATAHRNLGDVYTALAAVAYSKALDQDGQAADLGVQLELVTKLYGPPTSAATVVAQAPKQPAAPRIIDAPKPQPEPYRAPQKPTPKPAPVVATPAQPVQAAAPTSSPAVSQAGILQTVRTWASSWANQNVDTYLNSYADNFYPGDDLTLPQWRAQRRDRVSSPRSISVDVIDPKVQLDSDGRARVTFRQNYSADTYSDSVKKTLILEQKGGSGWKIVREISSPL